MPIPWLRWLASRQEHRHRFGVAREFSQLSVPVARQSLGDRIAVFGASIAGANNRDHSNAPWSSTKRAQVRTARGHGDDVRTFRIKLVRPRSIKRPALSAAGAAPGPLIATIGCPSRFSKAKQSPPIPVWVGSITANSAAAATAALTAFPHEALQRMQVSPVDGMLRPYLKRQTLPNGQDVKHLSSASLSTSGRSKGNKACIAQIPDEHRRVRNAQRRFGIGSGELERDLSFEGQGSQRAAR